MQVKGIKSKNLLKDDSADKKKMKVAFCHPDLGLGGAERLVVDAATELAKRGHAVEIYTAHYDPKRSFEETRQGLFPVHVRGAWFPRAFLGRFVALCAYIRCILVALSIIWESTFRGKSYDVIIVDQVSVVMPFLFFLTNAKTIFYCHFPDLLLSAKGGLLKRLYRFPLDTLEQLTTGLADLVLVNSNFTRAIFAKTFPFLNNRGLQPSVLYPAVPVPPKKGVVSRRWEELRPRLREGAADFVEGGKVFLSINRFERKKNLPLALRSLSLLLERQPHSGARLVMAGGYDCRLRENVDHLAELQSEARSLGISDKVLFLPSFSDAEREALLESCVAVLYTPENEHFGIVPLEAMAAARPVVACTSGGPLESVVDGRTGLLREPTPGAFCEAMEKLLEQGASSRMGSAAVDHVRASFSRETFGARLEEACLKLKRT